MTALSSVRYVVEIPSGSMTSTNLSAFNLGAGQHVFLYISYTYTGGTPPTHTITDTAGNTYTAMPRVNSGTLYGQWFVRVNANGNASNVITISFGGTINAPQIQQYVLAGTIPSVTQFSTASAAATTITKGATVSYAPGSMILIAEANQTPDYGARNFQVTASDSAAGVTFNYRTGTLYCAACDVPCPNSVNNAVYSLGFYGDHSDYRVLAALLLDVAGAPNPTPSTSKIKSSQIVVEVLQKADPAYGYLRSSQIVVEILQRQGSPAPTVRPIINDRDKLLQATQPRYGAGSSSAILLTGSTQTITNGAPATVSFTVTRLNVPGGTALFATVNGTPYTVNGDTATIQSADLTGSTETMTVSITDGGGTYTAQASVAVVSNGSSGTRGAGWYYATGNAWADAVAASACPGGPVDGDMVTIANGTTYALSKRYSGGTWIVPGTFLTGSLFVDGSIYAASLNTNNLTIRDSSGNIILGAGTTLDGAYISNLSADKITSGTLTIPDGSGGTLFAVGWLGNVVGYRRLSGYNIICSADADGASPAIEAMGLGAEGVRGTNTMGLSTSHGVRGTAATTPNGNTITSGIVGAQSGYDFYADGAGTNYGPFTGAHDALFAADEAAEPGDIVVDAECLARNGWSNTLFRVVRSSSPNQAAALGVLATTLRPLSETTPAVFTEHACAVRDEGPSETTQIVTTVDPLYAELVSAGYRLGGVNALGEGQINVVGEGGNIAAGDLIVTSSTPGKGMRQDSDIVKNITVARAREAATFTTADEVKTIACIYLAG